MKSSSTALFNTLRRNYVIDPSLRVYAEWNWNRFATTTASNDGAADLYPELFPIASIAESERPGRSGIAKIVDDNNYIPASSDWAPPRTRPHTADEEDMYKYWLSGKSNNVGLPDFTYAFASVVRPGVVYGALKPFNKLVAVVENSYVNLGAFTVQVTTDGTTWTTVATNPTVDINGRVELYRQPNGTWSSNFSVAEPVMLKGVRLNITSLDEPNTHIGVIEVSARAIYDFSPFVQEASTSFEVSDYSLLAPLGVASSNTATITLFNGDGRFNNDNPESPFYTIIDKGVNFIIESGIDTTDQGGAGVEWVRWATMASGVWTGQSELAVTVPLVDSSTRLQNTYPPQVLFQNETVGSIIWRLCDIVGFTNYEAHDTPEDYGTVVPYFWTDEESSVWETISSLCELTQTAAYFDEYDVLNIRSRNSAFDESQAVQWNLDAVPVGDKLPDIVELSSEPLDMDNTHIDIAYTPTKISDFNNGFPKMEVVWEPEELVLRGAALLTPITNASTTFMINPKESTTWPYEGKVNIDGELISYKGKKYYYWKNDGARYWQWVTSDEQKKQIDSSFGTMHSWRNAFSGDFLIVKRALEGTRQSDHGITATPEVAKRLLVDGAGGSSASTLGTFANSQFTVNTPADWQNGKKNLVLSYGAVDTVTNRYYGTRLKFNAGVGPESNGEAGVWIGGSTLYNGYYISLNTTGMVKANPGLKELIIYRRTTAGAMKLLASVDAEVLFGNWYDLDVFMNRGASADTVSVYLNGVRLSTIAISGADRVATIPEKTGVFVGTWTSVSFEYYYTVAAQAEMKDFPTFLDLVQKGYRSGLVTRNLLVSRIGAFGTLNTRSASQRAIFDDFGSIVHESRDFDVKFEPAPVVHSNLYVSNEIEAVCPKYTSSPFGARFTLENTARKNAILMGDDDTLFLGESVDQKTFIYGRVVNQEDVQKETFKNEAAIKRRGVVKMEYNSRWIQTKEAATALGAWLTDKWSDGTERVTVTVFGNPLLQVGDLVSVNYPAKNMDPDTHQYFVMTVSNAYAAGIETTMTLLRRKI